jgi:hypothetical protein
MRARTMAIGLIQAALLMACEDRSKNHTQAARDRSEVASNKAASPVSLGSDRRARGVPAGGLGTGSN